MNTQPTDAENELSDLAIETYLGFKGKAKKNYRRRKQAQMESEGSQPFTPGRDPNSIGNVLLNTATELGWSMSLSQAELFEYWSDLVGLEVASQTRPQTIREETLYVECSSTAWATQLRLMRGQLLRSEERRVGKECRS